VVVFGLGGTIAMAATPSGGVAPALSAHQLVAAVPGLAATGLELEVDDFRRLPGASLAVEDIVALAETIRARLDTGVHGVVVTQGTDTIEETAYLLDLLHTHAAPIVVTGAMRNPTLAGADGPANLLAGIQVAANLSAREQGALVVMADEIHAARRVQKTHSTSAATFQSPNGGPLGYVVEGRARLLNQLGHRPVVPLSSAMPLARVCLVTITMGDDGFLLDGMAGRLDGLVVAAFGAGHVPSRLVPQLEELAAHMPVVLASRTGAGPVLASTYAFSGSEKDLLERGLISAGFLDPIKARILLQLVLSANADAAEIRAALSVAGGYGAPTAWPWPVERTTTEGFVHA
jgi:L-asparaginase